MLMHDKCVDWIRRVHGLGLGHFFPVAQLSTNQMTSGTGFMFAEGPACGSGCQLCPDLKCCAPEDIENSVGFWVSEQHSDGWLPAAPELAIACHGDWIVAGTPSGISVSTLVTWMRARHRRWLRRKGPTSMYLRWRNASGLLWSLPLMCS